MPQHRIFEQIRRNSVALISLVVAISSLAYNTYRNELSEANRTTRQAGFEIISELSKLQQVMLFARYDVEDPRGETTVGWSHVLTIRDLSFAMPENIQQQAEKLFTSWQKHSRRISAPDDKSYKLIDKEIDETKEIILDSIKQLH